MTEHDQRILGPKSAARHDPDALAAFAASHSYCQACGADYRPLQIHHIIGGRGGRSDEAVNFLRLCGHPCHLLAEGLDIREEGRGQWREGWLGVNDELPPLIPKLTLAVQLMTKIRAGELEQPWVERSPSRMSAACLNNGAFEEYVSNPGWERLQHLHGRNLPAPEPIPAFFAELFRKNRPELFTGQ